MNLEELKYIVDRTIEHLHDYENPKEIPVLITLSENSIGSRASCEVSFVGMGFDWEHGQFRIEPSKSLVRKGNAPTDTKKIIRHEFGGQKFWACPKCVMKVAKDDGYCRHCGQRLR